MRGRPGWAGAAALVAVLGVAALWLFWSPLDANDVAAGDEGYYGTLARNLIADRAQWWSPSLTPLGPPGDKPPLYPALLAPSIRWFGPGAPALRWPSVALAVLIALGTGALARRAARAAGSSEPVAQWAGVGAASMLMTLPWYGDASRTAMSDIPMTAAGVAALVVVAGGALSTRRALAAGALLGLAFQCKLWLAGVFVLPALLAVGLASGGTRRAALVLLGTAALVGLLHLAAVTVFEPEHLAHWIDIYWRRMLVERVGDQASVYARPPGYYAALLSRALVLVLPLAALGLDHLRTRWRAPAALAVLAACGGALALSAFAVKSAVYVYALLPAWVVAAAAGAAAIASGAARPGIFTAGILIASLPGLVRATDAGAPPLAAWALAWGSLAAALGLARFRPRLAPAAALTLCALAAGGGLARQAVRLPQRYHDPGLRVVADALAPVLADVPAGRPAFVAPEVPTLAYHLFRTGLYWSTPAEPWSAARRQRIMTDTTLRAFVVDPGGSLYGGGPDAATLAWLERERREITREIESRAGRRIALRVFVREAAR